MNQKNYLPGLLLRMERIRQKKKQKEVCFGLCVISYLSKIEHGRAEADPDLQRQLFARLGIPSETEAAVIRQGQEQIESCYQKLLYGILDWKADYEKLLALGEGLAYSICALDWHLLGAIYQAETGDMEKAESAVRLLRQLEEAMELRQRGFFRYLERKLLLAAPDLELEKDRLIALAEEQCRYLDCAFSKCGLAEMLLISGDLARIHQMEQLVTAQALQEGNLYYLAYFYIIQGTAYAVLDQEKLMMVCYERVEHLLKYSIWKDELWLVYYNIGATCLTLKKYEQALSYLNRLEDSAEYRENTNSYFSWKHKETLVCLRSGRREEGMRHLAELKSCLDAREDSSEADRLRYEEAVWETKEDYQKDPAYLKLLEELLTVLEREAPFGYQYFYREQIVQACEKQRCYRKALEYEQKFSKKYHKL